MRVVYLAFITLFSLVSCISSTTATKPNLSVSVEKTSTLANEAKSPIPNPNEVEFVFAGHVQYDVDPVFGVVMPEQSSLQIDVTSDLVQPIHKRVYFDKDGDYFIISKGLYKEPYSIDVTISGIETYTNNGKGFQLSVKPLHHSFTEKEDTGIRGEIVRKDNKKKKRLFFLPFISIAIESNGNFRAKDIQPSQEDQIRQGIKIEKLFF